MLVELERPSRETANPHAGKPNWFWLRPNEGWSREGTEWGKRLSKVSRQFEEQGIGGYWKQHFVVMALAESLPELLTHFEYCQRVSDQSNPLFEQLTQLKNKRQEELAG